MVPLCVLLSLFSVTAAFGRTRNVVLLAGKRSHPPGMHEYLKSVKLLKVLLDRSGRTDIRTEFYFDGWPEDPRVLDRADTIVTFSDGQDGDRYSPVPWMTDDRMRIIEKQIKRGCGFMTVHFSTFAPRQYGPRMLEWTGGYFEWQAEDGSRKWTSDIKKLDTDVTIASPRHPVARGLQPFHMNEEFYYRMKFRESDQRLQPILQVPALPGTPLQQTVAWAVQREDGGRGFATTTGHFFSHWQDANWRRMILNAVVWTAGLDVPSAGVESAYVPEDEVNRALLTKPIRTLIVTGANHPSHKWQETTPALAAALNCAKPRFDVTVTHDPEDLAKPDLRRYDLVVLNYANWEKPGLSEAAKAGFVKYLNSGGGLIAIHFANGAFHASLPGAGASSDWPEYRRIVRRVWNGEKGKSSHDRYGKMKVRVTNPGHPIMRTVADFETTDELYFKQEGDEPVEVLATARSNVTNRDEPMAWVYNYGKARVFQTVLGHAAISIQHFEVEQMLHQAGLWAARRR